MSVSLNYNRPSATLVNATPLLTTLFVSELPDALAAIGGTGTTGVLSAEVRVDADETAGVDVQTMWRLTATPTLSSDGKYSLTVVVTPVGGAGGNLPAQTLAVQHPETADAWQSAAGRPRQ